MTYWRLLSQYMSGFHRGPGLTPCCSSTRCVVLPPVGASSLACRANPGTDAGPLPRRGLGCAYIIFTWFQVKNFSDVHPDYGARVQALLDKYNAEKPKVSLEQPRMAVTEEVCPGLDEAEFAFLS